MIRPKRDNVFTVPKAQNAAKELPWLMEIEKPPQGGFFVDMPALS